MIEPRQSRRVTHHRAQASTAYPWDCSADVTVIARACATVLGLPRREHVAAMQFRTCDCLFDGDANAGDWRTRLAPLPAIAACGAWSDARCASPLATLFPIVVNATGMVAGRCAAREIEKLTVAPPLEMAERQPSTRQRPPRPREVRLSLSRRSG